MAAGPLWPRRAALRSLAQGSYLDRPTLRDDPWLDTAAWLRRQLNESVQILPPTLAQFQTHPLTAPLRQSAVPARLHRLWAEREMWLNALERMPHALCHGDFVDGNLFSRPLAGGREQTVVIDWQYAGRRPLGGDVAGLIADCAIIPPPRRRLAFAPEEFTELLLDRYLAGIQDSGWKGDLRLVRFACLAHLVLVWGVNLTYGLRHLLGQPHTEENRPQLEQKLDEYVRRQEFVLERVASQARRLLEALSP